MSDMKCPFCQQKLECCGSYIYGTKKLGCANCGLSGDSKLFSELIRTRKALGIATKCINWVIGTFQKGLEHEAEIVGCCELSLWNIEGLERKD